MNTPNGFWGDPDGYGDVSYSTASNSFMTSTTPPATAATYVPLTDQPTGSYTPPPLTPTLSSLFSSPAPPPLVVPPVVVPPVKQDFAQPMHMLPPATLPASGAIEPAPFAGGTLQAKPFEPKPFEPKPFEPKPFEPKPFEPKPFEAPSIGIPTPGNGDSHTASLASFSREPIDPAEPLPLTPSFSINSDDSELFGPASFGVLVGAVSTTTNSDPASTSHIPRVTSDPTPTAFIPATPPAAAEATTTFSPDTKYESAPYETISSATVGTYDEPEQRPEPRRAERGMPSIFAFAILLGISGVGGYLDLHNGAQVKGSFGIALIVGSLLAILFVRRSSMFTIVVAPPLVYFGAAAAVLYARSDGLANRSALINGAINWLVYGFPAIAGATAAVLIVAGVRMIIRK